MCFFVVVDDVQQFVFVTEIDHFVPNIDMKSVFMYRSLKDYCKEVSEKLGIDIKFVHPIANYVEELSPNDAKSTLALMALWHVVHCGKRHIEQKCEPCFDDN